MQLDFLYIYSWNIFQSVCDFCYFPVCDDMSYICSRLLAFLFSGIHNWLHIIIKSQTCTQVNDKTQGTYVQQIQNRPLKLKVKIANRTRGLKCDVWNDAWLETISVVWISEKHYWTEWMTGKRRGPTFFSWFQLANASAKVHLVLNHEHWFIGVVEKLPEGWLDWWTKQWVNRGFCQLPFQEQWFSRIVSVVCRHDSPSLLCSATSKWIAALNHSNDLLITLWFWDLKLFKPTHILNTSWCMTLTVG